MIEHANESRPPGEEHVDSMNDLLDASERYMQSLQRGDIIEGYLVHVEPEEALVDVGLKSEGIVTGRELGSEEEMARLQVGEKVLVYVLQPENAEGHPVLSLRRAQAERYWRRAEEQFASGEIVEAPVIDANRGGLIVDVGIRGFVPISQVQDLRREEPVAAEGEGSSAEDATLRRLQEMIGRRLKVKIIELNRPRNRLIVSQRAAMQEWRGQRKEALLAELHPGDIRQGQVTSLTDFGAFVDLGGADGLVHISELSWTRVTHPRQVVQVGQTLDVAVVSVDPETKKIALSLKQAQPDPWVALVSEFAVGQIIPASITKLAKFGAFARLPGGVEGLIHISELADRHVASPGQVVSEGEDVAVKITNIDIPRRRLGLSLRQAREELESTPPEPAASLEGPEGHDILDEDPQPENVELQKLAALRFDDDTAEA
ncbi:MAG: 30S ribosomal protein S1 [Chloroflexota bacterium]